MDLFPEVTEVQLLRIGVRTLGHRMRIVRSAQNQLEIRSEAASERPETEENEPVTERSKVNENEVAHPENKVNGGNENYELEITRRRDEEL